MAGSGAESTSPVRRDKGECLKPSARPKRQRRLQANGAGAVEELAWGLGSELGAAADQLALQALDDGAVHLADTAFG